MIKIIILTLIFVLVQGTILSANEIDAVYNYKKWDCKVTKDGLVEKVSKKITIYNKRGDFHNRVYFSKSCYMSLDKIKCIVYNSKGEKVYSRSDKDMNKQEGFGASFELYNDNIVYYTDLPAPEYPYSIETSYEKKYKSLFFWRGVDFIEDIPIDTFSYDLEIDNTIGFNYQAPIFIGSPGITEKGNKNLYKWYAENIDGIDYKYFEPQLGVITSLKIVPTKLSLNNYEIDSLSWKNIGLWYNELSADKYVDFDIPRDSISVLDFAQREYEKLINKTRYVAVSIGMSGWQPADATTTLECGYGDCKGMSTLLISQLKCEDIDIYPVLVLTRQAGFIDSTFPELGFNHLITMAVIDNDTIWMDPTCSNCPFGEIPWSDENINVLVITDTGGVLIKSPVTQSEQNQFVSNTQVTINSEINADMSSKITTTGNIARRFRNIFSRYDNDDISEFIKDNILFSNARFYDIKWKHENIDDINKPFLLTIDGMISNPVKKFGKELFVQPSFLHYGVFNAIGDNDSDHVISFSYPKSSIDSITIVWSDSLQIDSIIVPEYEFIEFSIGNSQINSIIENNEIKVVLESHVVDYFLEASEMKLYKEFIKEHLSLINQKIVFIQN